MKNTKKSSEKLPTNIDLRGEGDLEFSDTAMQLFSDMAPPDTVQDANKLLHECIISHGCLIRKRLALQPYKEILSSILALDSDHFNIFTTSTTSPKAHRNNSRNNSFSQFILTVDGQGDNTQKHDQHISHALASCKLIVNRNEKRLLDEELLKDASKQGTVKSHRVDSSFEQTVLYQIFLKLRISLMNHEICKRKASLVKLHGAKLFSMLSKLSAINSYKSMPSPEFTDIIFHFSKLMSLDLLYKNAKFFNDSFMRSVQSSFSSHNRKLGLRKLDVQYEKAISMAKSMWSAGDQRKHWQMARHLYETICKPIEHEIKKELIAQYPSRKSAKVKELFERELAKRIRYETMSIEKLKDLLAPIADDPSINKYDNPAAAHRKSKKS